MSNITKEQWKKIEESLSDMFVSDAQFKYKGFRLPVQRVRLGETKLALRVYINGEMKGSWFTDAFDGKANKVTSIFKDVYKEVTRSTYSAKYIKQAEKALGKRKLKELIPDLHEKKSYWLPDFSKASVLCRQYKKLEGLELISLE